MLAHRPRTSTTSSRPWATRSLPLPKRSLAPNQRNLNPCTRNQTNVPPSTDPSTPAAPPSQTHLSLPQSRHPSHQTSRAKQGNQTHPTSPLPRMQLQQQRRLPASPCPWASTTYVCRTLRVSVSSSRPFWWTSVRSDGRATDFAALATAPPARPLLGRLGSRTSSLSPPRASPSLSRRLPATFQGGRALPRLPRDARARPGVSVSLAWTPSMSLICRCPDLAQPLAARRNVKDMLLTQRVEILRRFRRLRPSSPTRPLQPQPHLALALSLYLSLPFSRPHCLRRRPLRPTRTTPPSPLARSTSTA